jgi:signal transduction histidine kinase
MRRSIRNQIVGLVGVTLAVALGAYLLLASGVLVSDRLLRLNDVTSLLSRTAAQHVGAALGAVSDKLRYVGAHAGELETYFSGSDGIFSVRMFDREGGSWRETQHWVAPQAPAQLIDAQEITPLQLDVVKAAGTPVVQNVSRPGLALARISVAVNDERVVVADLAPSKLFDSEGQSDRLYRVYLLDSGGLVLAHPDPEKVLQRADFSSVPVVREALKGPASSGTKEYDNALGGWVASWVRPQGAQLLVIAEAPREEALKPITQLTWRAVGFGVLMIGLTLLLAMYFSRRVSSPLAALEQTIRRVSSGELGAEVDVSSANEIGALADSFNQMSRELSRRAEELDRKNQQLVQSEKMSAIGELSAGLAHEVKNPMVGIVGFAQLGQESTSLEEAREYFKLIDNDAQRANGILQNLLEFARPPDVEQEILDFNQVVQGAVRLTAHQLQLNGVKVQTVYAEGLPKIRGNGNQLRQVLLNLMMNASQAMEGSPERRLHVETKGGDAGAQVSVRDTGPGIAPEAQARLFEPFFTTKPRGKGTGLGLSVSRSIIEAHKGEIRVESELGKGATFFIRLPAADGMPDVSGPFRLDEDMKATRH